MSPHEIGEVLAVLLFLSTVFVVMLGFPVAFTLGGTAVLFALLGEAFGAFNFDLSSLAERYFGTMTNEVLVAVPLFVFMGVVLERSGVAERLLIAMGRLFGRLRGGLGASVVIVGALLAASTGIVGATVVTMGLLSLPAMLRAGYDPKLATGVICASGTLGQIIPPSTVLIFIGDILQGANATAQMAKGNFAPDPVSVGQLFAGAVIPGILLAGLYLLWVLFRAWINPGSAPALKPDMLATASGRGAASEAVVALIAPILLILAVLGSIMASIATPTESASVGAVGAMILARVNGAFDLAKLRAVMRSTMTISSMVFVVLMGASAFSLVFRGLGGDILVERSLSGLPGGAFGAILAVMAVMFVLGFFLDTFEIIFIVVPIAGPVLLGFDISPVWLGVMMGVNLQTSFLTPPFGFALFYLRGIAPASVRTADIYRGIGPFVAIQVVAMGLVWAMPAFATWLPGQVFATRTVDADGHALPVISNEDALKGFLNDFEGDPADAGQ